MLHLRLIFGTTLSLLALIMIGLDGYLSRAAAESSNLWRWFAVGGLSTLLAMAFALAATGELIRMSRARGARPLVGVAYFFAAGFVAGPYIAAQVGMQTGRYDSGWSMGWLALATTLAFVMQAARSRARQAAANIAATLFIIVYAGGLTGFLVRIRMEIGGADGVLLLLLSIFTIKINDTGAFFIGRSFGRRKMIEWLSPKKTWEGFAGGIASAIVFALIAGSILRYTGTPIEGAGLLAYPWGLILFGLIMGLASVIGDLCASLLKRDAEVKDTGAVVPGMGGALDILDSLLIGAPAAWFFWTRMAGSY